MKKKLSKLAAIVTSLGLMVTSATVTDPLSCQAKSKYDSAKSEKSVLEGKKKEVESVLADLETKKGNTLKYIEELDKKVNEYQSKVDELSEKIDTKELDLSKTQEKLEVAKEDETEQYDVMKKRIQYMYVNGNTQYLQLLLSSESIADFLNRSEYVKQISDYDKNMLEQYQNVKKEVVDTENTIAKDVISLNDMNVEMTEKKEAVEVLVSKKKEELEKFNKGISKSKNEISDYEKSIAKQDSIIEGILAEQRRKALEEEKRRQEEERRNSANNAYNSARNSSSYGSSASGNSNGDRSDYGKIISSGGSGGYCWPVPSSHRITCGFGYRTAPTAGASSYHHAIDIGAPLGSSVVATRSGTVIQASWNGGYGNFIGISHGNGVFSYYGHLSSIGVSVGQKVSAGQVIGKVGSTGISTGPHLDFSININGNYVNPTNYVH